MNLSRSSEQRPIFAKIDHDFLDQNFCRRDGRICILNFEKRLSICDQCLPDAFENALSLHMRDVKDTPRALVRISYDGRVFKTFRGPNADERFGTEVKVLRHLEESGCPFVPRLLEADAEQLRIVTTNCGTRVDHLDNARRDEIFAELGKFGVRHDDAETRNITYRQSDGRFCVIDFEFATILPEPEKKPDGAPA